MTKGSLKNNFVPLKRDSDQGMKKFSADWDQLLAR